MKMSATNVQDTHANKLMNSIFAITFDLHAFPVVLDIMICLLLLTLGPKQLISMKLG